MENRLQLDGGCTLTGTRVFLEHATNGWWWFWKTVYGTSTWSRPQTCPAIAPSNAFNGDERYALGAVGITWQGRPFDQVDRKSVV